MKVTFSLRDMKTLEKSELELQGDSEELSRQVDQMKMFLTKKGFEILDWTLDMEGGKTAGMAAGPCVACGKPGMCTYNKVEKNPEGILVSRVSLSLCQRDFDRFIKDPKERVKLMTMGLQAHVSAPQRAGSGE